MLGWIGALAFGICGAPQAYKAYHDGNAEGLSWSFLGLWSIGEVLTLVAVICDGGKSYLLANYLANAVFLGVMWRYKLAPVRLVQKPLQMKSWDALEEHLEYLRDIKLDKEINMTLPDERTRAILNTQQFLRDLLDPKKTPKVPREIRKQAYWCLRHYPSTHEMVRVIEGKVPEIFAACCHMKRDEK